jgi:hypothetical protein
VVPDYESAKLLSNEQDVPPVAVIEPDNTHEQFVERLNSMIPLWRRRTLEARRTIAPLDHPHRNFLEIEKKRLMDLAGRDEELLARCMKALEELLAEDYPS